MADGWAKFEKKRKMDEQEADLGMALILAEKPRGKTGPGAEQTSTFR